MPKGKEEKVFLEKQIIDVHQSEKGDKAISKQSEV